MNYSWGDAEKRLRAQKREQAAALQRQKENAARQDALHKKLVAPINKTVEQFIQAMREAGSPGLMRYRKNTPVKFDPVSRRLAENGFWLIGGWQNGTRVYKNGDWHFHHSYTDRSGGGIVNVTRDNRDSSMPVTKEWYEKYHQGLILGMTSLLAEHGVPHPKD